jgi:hypothetical protein
MDFTWALALVPFLSAGAGAYFGGYLKKKFAWCWLYSRGLAHLYVLCKGGDDEIGGEGWKIATQAA